MAAEPEIATESPELAAVTVVSSAAVVLVEVLETPSPSALGAATAAAETTMEETGRFRFTCRVEYVYLWMCFQWEYCLYCISSLGWHSASRVQYQDQKRFTFKKLGICFC